MSQDNQNSGPPDAPEIKRRLMFHPLQLIGMPLVILIPVLALLGFFGETQQNRQISSPDFGLYVEYYDRTRYQSEAMVRAAVRNLTDEPIPAVTVAFDRDYIDSFSEVTMMPDVRQITERDYEVELTNLLPGQTYWITLDMKGEKYGQHQGSVTVEAEGLESVEVNLSTFIFP
jgi:hypothetical protein